MRRVVLRSIEAPGGAVCVDLWRTGDGACGYTACRRDPEDPRGWAPLGLEEGGFATPEAALESACRAFPWVAASPDRA